MKIALAHDYLIQMGGAERVVAAMHAQHPDSPIFTSAVDRNRLMPELRGAAIRTSWMQHLPAVAHHSHFKKYLPLYPLAFHSFHPVKADVLWISCSTFAKFLRAAPGTRTVCYLHNTTRFLWQSESYAGSEVRGPLVRALLAALRPAFRVLDRRAAASMDTLIANSENVRRRVAACYHRDARVVHPPVNLSRFPLSTGPGTFALVVSRLLAYKNLELAVRAFSGTGNRLVIVGEGPDRVRLENLAGPEVEFAGRLGDEAVRDLYATCEMFLLPGEEDFGITPLEAMACGKPVVALGRGGALETVQDGLTGTFFREETPAALAAAVERCRTTRWNPECLRNRALEFSEAAFTAKMRAILEESI